MNFKEYQSLALVTNADLGSEKLNLAHMVIGMCSELNELETALYNEDVVNISEECTDEFWYLANFCTLLNISLEEFDYSSYKEFERDSKNYGIVRSQKFKKFINAIVEANPPGILLLKKWLLENDYN